MIWEVRKYLKFRAPLRFQLVARIAWGLFRAWMTNKSVTFTIKENHKTPPGPEELECCTQEVRLL